MHRVTRYADGGICVFVCVGWCVESREVERERHVTCGAVEVCNNFGLVVEVGIVEEAGGTRRESVFVCLCGCGIEGKFVYLKNLS